MSPKSMAIMVCLVAIFLFITVAVFRVVSPGHVEVNIGKRLTNHDDTTKTSGLEVNIGDDITEVDECKK